MKTTYDKEADAMYIYLSRGRVFKTVPITERVIVDFDKKGKVVGVEMLDVSVQFSKNNLSKLNKKISPVSV